MLETSATKVSGDLKWLRGVEKCGVGRYYELIESVFSEPNEKSA